MTVTKKIKKKRKLVTKKIKDIIEELDVDLDPRKQAFALAYCDPMSNTYANALQSGLKVGFSQEYSENITFRAPKWLAEISGKLSMIETVKKNIKKHLELGTFVPVIGMTGPVHDKITKELVYAEDAKLLKLQQDMTMFVAEKLVPDFKKKEKFDLPPQKVEIKQIIIIAPNGGSIPYNSTNAEAISSVSETS